MFAWLSTFPWCLEELKVIDRLMFQVCPINDKVCHCLKGHTWMVLSYVHVYTYSLAWWGTGDCSLQWTGRCCCWLIYTAMYGQCGCHIQVQWEAGVLQRKAEWLPASQLNVAAAVFFNSSFRAETRRCTCINVAIQALAPMPRQELCSGECVINTWLLKLRSSGSAEKHWNNHIQQPINWTPK